MKRIISGKTYNTETAELIISGNNGLYTNDIYYRCEELYLTKKGNYFVCNSQNYLLPVNQDGKIINNDFNFHIFDWLEEWKIESVDQKTIDYFKIIEA